MFDGTLPEIGELAAADDAAVVDAAAGWARVEAAACARKQAAMAELFCRRTGLDNSEDRDDWWIDPCAAVTAELAAAQGITPGLALAQTHRGVTLADRLPKVGALFEAGLLIDLLVRTIVWRTALIIEAEAMASVDAALAEQVSSWGALSMKKTEQAIDALVDKFDPGALRRSRTASRARDVVIGSPTDEAGFTSLWGRLYAPDAAALDRRLEAMARAACAEDPRTLAERRADALGALAAGGDRLGCECAGANCSAGQRDRAPSTVRKQKSAIQRLQVPEQGHQPAQTMPADDHSKDRNHWGVPVGGLGRPRAHKKPKCRWSRLAERGHRELLVALNLRRGRHLRRAERASATIPATRTVVLQLEHHQRRKAIRDFERQQGVP